MQLQHSSVPNWTKEILTEITQTYGLIQIFLFVQKLQIYATSAEAVEDSYFQLGASTLLVL